MRLRDSLTRELRELRAGRRRRDRHVRVRADRLRPHPRRATPARTCVFQLIKRYLEWRGQPVRLVENITDVNDKIYIAARQRGVGLRPSWRARWRAAYIADTDRLGIGRPDASRWRPRRCRRSSRLIEELIAAGHAYEAERRRVLRGAQLSGYGRLSGQDPDQLIEGARVEPGEHKRDPLDFALWKAAKPDEDTCLGVALGPGPAGLAHRVLGDGGALPGPPSSRVHGGGRDLIFPHHENEVAQSCARRPAVRRRSGRTTGCCGCPARRCRSRSATSSRCTTRSTSGGRRRFCCSCCAPTTPARSTTRTRPWSRRGRRRRRCGTGCATATDGRERSAARTAFRDALDDDFNTPRALALLFDAPPEAARHASREVLDVLGLGGLADEEQAPAELVREGAASASGRAPTATSPAPTRCATRSTRPAGRCATPPTGPRSTAVAAELVYGRHAVREALRGRREVLRVWCTDGRGEAQRVAARARRGSSRPSG